MDGLGQFLQRVLDFLAAGTFDQHRDVEHAVHACARPLPKLEDVRDNQVQDPVTVLSPLAIQRCRHLLAEADQVRVQGAFGQVPGPSSQLRDERVCVDDLREHLFLVVGAAKVELLGTLEPLEQLDEVVAAGGQ